MHDQIEGFIAEDDGAVTVDWVVLSAAIISMVIFVMGVMKTQLDGNAVNLADQVTTRVDEQSSAHQTSGW